MGAPLHLLNLGNPQSLISEHSREPLNILHVVRWLRGAGIPYIATMSPPRVGSKVDHQSVCAAAGKSMPTESHSDVGATAVKLTQTSSI